LAKYDQSIPPFTPDNGSWLSLDEVESPTSVETMARGGPESAQTALNSLLLATQRALDGRFHAVVTAPVNKQAILKAGVRFIGQTEFIAEICGVERFAMMLLGHDERNRWLRVALATTHLPLSLVPTHLSAATVRQAIALAAEACQQLALPRQRIAVCGLNPHAGEGGTMGTEELTIIGPAIYSAANEGIDVSGPWPADTVFYQALKGDYDAVVAMYHDQGLGPLKTVAFDTGVNWTLGLPFPRTSPDHGTAYDIAGRGMANPASMECAIRLALDLAGRNPRD
jgi:4-hydroxythreonine-4-phosphate dehydrogenase